PHGVTAHVLRHLHHPLAALRNPQRGLCAPKLCVDFPTVERPGRNRYALLPNDLLVEGEELPPVTVHRESNVRAAAPAPSQWRELEQETVQRPVPPRISLPPGEWSAQAVRVVSLVRVTAGVIHHPATRPQ